MGTEVLELDYERFEKACEENGISSERLLDFVEAGRIIVETVDAPTALNMTNRNTKTGKTTNFRVTNFRFNIKKFVNALPSLILDVCGINGTDIKSIVHAYRFGNTMLSLFSIELNKNESNLLYSLWRMDTWDNDISWEKAFEETNKLSKEMGDKPMTEDEFCEVLDSLRKYGLIKLSQESISNWEDGKNNSIRVMDHLLRKIDK